MNRLIWPYLHFLGLSHRELDSLSKLFKDPEPLLDSIVQKRTEGILPPDRQNLLFEASKQASFSRFEADFSKTGAKVLFSFEGGFPEGLKHIPNSPFYLSFLWNIRSDIPLLSIVGSRRATSYGRERIEEFVPSLVRAGYGIVSGGAIGIDSLVHEATLEASGYVISIIGSGINRPHPSSNRGLFDRIVGGGGAVISHFPFSSPPFPYNFPIRNELIAGISRGSLLIEAREKSGTLITARLALELGRDVFAIPGDVGREGSTGTNALIRSGAAKLVLSAEDILSEYEGIERLQTFMAIPKTPNFQDQLSKKIYDSVKNGYTHPDKIARECLESVEKVLACCLMLELSGIIRQLPNGEYAL